MDVSAHLLANIAGAHIREMRMLFIELCGVFWIAAEMLILFFMIEARRHVGRHPVPAGPVWDAFATRRAILFCMVASIFLLAVLVRPFLWVPLHIQLQDGPVSVYSAATADFLAVQRHLAVWAGFVTVWVILEMAIVYQGYRTYQALCRRLDDGAGAAPGGAGVGFVLPLLLIVGFAVTAGLVAIPATAADTVPDGGGQPVNDWAQVLTISESWLSPYRNAVYLYLRLSGIVWIGVEWVAAAVLLRAHGRIRRVLRIRKGLLL